MPENFKFSTNSSSILYASSALGFRGCSACSLKWPQIWPFSNSRSQKHDRWEYVIISPVLHFGHTCTPNKFQLNLLAHLEAFVYQKCHRLWLFSSMWLLNSLVALLAISHLSVVSFSVLNYANNKLNKKKLHKEQELLVEHCFCVIFTFLLCKFLVELQFRGEFHFIAIFHSWAIVSHGRLSRKWIIPIYPCSDSYRYTNL